MSVYTDVPEATADPIKVAGRIKRLFCKRKRERHGRYTLPERFNVDEFWEAAAAQCIRLQVSPATYIEAAFKFCRVPGGPFPQHLGKQAIVGWVDHYRKTLGDPVEAFRAELEAFKRNVEWVYQTSNQRITPMMFLTETQFNQDINPCVALAYCPAPPVIRLYGADALDAFESDPVLEEVFSKLHISTPWIQTVKANRDEYRLSSRT